MFYHAIVFLPLLGAIIAGIASLRQHHNIATLVSIAGVCLSLVLSCFAFVEIALGGQALTVEVARWIGSGDFQAHWTLRFDTLTAVMLIVVTGVSSCVHIYSVGYMSHDKARGRFMAYLSLFTFAMLMLVTADNLVQLFKVLVPHHLLKAMRAHGFSLYFCIAVKEPPVRVLVQTFLFQELTLREQI